MDGRIQVVDHPLVAARLSAMRDVATDNAGFRAALRDLSTLLVYEALRDLETRISVVETPVAEGSRVEIAEEVIFVPILRAGLGMLESATALVPDARVGFIGMARNEATHEPSTYLESLPDDLSNQHVVVLDPMLATGGSLVACLEYLKARAAQHITVVCVLAAPEGLARIEAYDADLKVVTASIDERLNDHAYIVPGLGDAGDRQFGAI